MNRFHLLSIEDENSSDTTVPTATDLVANNPADSPAKTPSRHGTNKHGKQEGGKFDRRPKGPRKGEGEKHQTVGKGSWGRPLDNAVGISADTATDELAGGEAKVPEQEETVKFAYQTVSEYLAAQQSAQQRLVNLCSVSARCANEGAEVEDMEVIKKSDDILVIGNHATSSKKFSAFIPSKESSGMKKLTLQDLNKVLPLNVPRTERNDRAPRRESDRKREQSRLHGRERRRFGRENDNQRHPFNKGPIIDIKDEAAFPTLA